MSGNDDKGSVGVPGRARAVAKRALEEVIWARVAVNNVRHRTPPLPTPVKPTDVLATAAQWQASTAEAKKLGLILHHDGPKNWDALGAVSTVLHELGTDIRVLDAGAARYSNVLPSLALYGVRDLVGNNLEFDRTHSHGKVRFEPGDATSMMYRDGWFDAVTCMSVIEHGVPIDEFFAESARVLRSGGLLIVSTDYAQNPPRTDHRLRRAGADLRPGRDSGHGRHGGQGWPRTDR